MNNIFHQDRLANVVAQANFPPENPLAHVVNGERNRLLLSLANGGKENFTLVNAAASYHDVGKDWALVSVVTAMRGGRSVFERDGKSRSSEGEDEHRTMGARGAREPRRRLQRRLAERSEETLLRHMREQSYNRSLQPGGARLISELAVRRNRNRLRCSSDGWSEMS